MGKIKEPLSLVKRITVEGMLIALALILSYLERLIPLNTLVPIPGVKLGLANIVTIIALFQLGVKSAASVTALRCVVANILFGTAVSMVFALSGSLLALAVMIALKSGHGRYFSIIGISAGGAAAHNIGQLAAATVTLGNTAVLAYLPTLMVASVFTGFITGVVAISVIKALGTIRPGYV